MLTAATAKDGHQIQIKMVGAKDTVYLAYHYGTQVYLQDTAVMDKKGVATFSGDKPLVGGIYVGLINTRDARGKKGNKYFDFLVNRKEQHFLLETDTADFVKNMKVTGSEANNLFFAYQRFLSERQPQMAKLKTQLDSLEKKPAAERDTAQATNLRNRLRTYDEEINQYRIKLIREQPDSYLASIFRAMREPEVPKAILQQKDATGKPNNDAAFRYFRNHFWDDFDLTDERLVRTPILQSKVSSYLDTYTVRNPDTLTQAAMELVEKTRPSKEVYKAVLTQIMGMYENPKYMGLDAIFVRLAEKYYLTGQTDWMDSTRMAKLKERVVKMKSDPHR